MSHSARFTIPSCTSYAPWAIIGEYIGTLHRLAKPFTTMASIMYVIDTIKCKWISTIWVLKYAETKHNALCY